MGRYGFDLGDGKMATVSTHGYFFVYVKDSDPRIVTHEGKVVDLGLRYNPYIDDLEGPEYDAEDDGWAFIQEKLRAYLASVEHVEA